MSAKNLDKKGRIRNVMVSFRVSSAECKELNNRVKLSNKTRLFIGQYFVSESECEWESVDVCEIPSALGLDL